MDCSSVGLSMKDSRSAKTASELSLTVDNAFRPSIKSRSLFFRRRSLSPQPERRTSKPQRRTTPDKPETRSAAEIFLHPGRVTRPAKTAIVLRGLPGSGKSRLAKLMKDLEAKHGSGELRVLSLDDYFLVESDLEVETSTGKKIQKGMKYEYDSEMEASYQAALVKSFVKQLEARHFDVLVVDAPNAKLTELTKFVKAASEHAYVPFVMETGVDDPELCFERNVHERELEDIQKIKAEWEEVTGAFTVLDPSALSKDEEDIQEVEMDEIQPHDEQEHQSAFSDDSNAEEFCDEEAILVPSKWEKMEKTEEKLSRLDGIKKKSAVMKMDEFLTVTDDYELRGTSEKKRVRWADIEERKRIDRAKAIGFVVGQTDWSAFTDSHTEESKALTQTKYF